MKWTLYSLVFLVSVSCSNVFESFSETGSDEALLFQAKEALSAKNYSSVITIVESMTTEGQADRSVRLVKASAFGGLCGVEFLSFLSAVANSSASTFFLTLMNTMSSADATKQGNCESAVDELRLISTTASSRTDDENMLMTVVALGTIGTILNKNADTDDNQAVDGSFNYCTTTSDSDLNRLVASMAETFQSLESVGSSTVANTDMSNLSSACTALAGETPPLDFCSKTDHTAVTSDERLGMKGVVGSDESIGLATCDGSVVACAAGC